jgi:FMN reductase, SsuE family
MAKVVIISGSPTPSSRLNAFIEISGKKLAESGIEVKEVFVAQLPSEDLVKANFQSEAIQEKLAWVSEADAVIFASPVYKASYTGVLKLFLDLIPERGLKGKIVLPLFVAGTMAHMLAIDYALKPVIAALAGRHILGGVYGVDKMIERTDSGFVVQADLLERLDQALEELVYELNLRHSALSVKV